MANYYKARALRYAHHELFGVAANLLEKAAELQPRMDDVAGDLGETYFKLATTTPTADDTTRDLSQSEYWYRRAIRLNPLNADSFYGLARTRVLLQQVDDTPPSIAEPADTATLFEKSIALRPNAVTYRLAFLRFLHQVGDETRLKQTLKELMVALPAAFPTLEQEPYWTDALLDVCAEGLETAARQNITPRIAWFMLSDIALRKGDPTQAVARYRQGMNVDAFENSAAVYTHLGTLHLKNGDYDKAETAFIASLRLSESRNHQLHQILNAFRSEKAETTFDAFYAVADRLFRFTAVNDLLLAQSLLDQKRYDEAKKFVEAIIRKKPSHEAYYLLSQIAAAQGDLDAQEIALQKTTVLDPRNSRYHHLFSQLLVRMKKYKSAEQAATMAIDTSKERSANLYTYRASIRKTLDRQADALADYESAIRLSPYSAQLHAAAAECLIRLGSPAKAAEYYRKAASLAPGNKGYAEKARELGAKTP